MVRFTALLFALCCTLFSFTGCNKEDQLRQLGEADFELLVKDLDIDMDIVLYQRLDFGHSEQEKFSALLGEAAEDFFAASDFPLNWMTIKGHYDYTKIDAGEQTAGGDAVDHQSGRWITIGDGLCQSPGCVRRKLEAAYAVAGEPKSDQFLDARFERRATGVAVTYRKVLE
ncbi:hypothetical protein QWY85_20090 [Neolewinella lacunae]|uniref:Uncharacterized protein n=1 Tax=Neolewinella lacunae TaxID=1517758 RepID=A0A923PMU4_9BACT|nr:hypothetical protein [Neolewinella lacunae]MBC6996359.1 hypothetical protein [Neolewinella lacunae]MDN3636982.1 hypothetical protein [Neolewinella lacunae]